MPRSEQFRGVNFFATLIRYPHQNVPKVSNVQAVQTGIYYSPQIEFYCFDIMRETTGEQGKYEK